MLSCKSETTSVPRPVISSNEEKTSSNKAGWELEWEKALKNSKKEASVILYAGPGMATVRNVVLQELKNKYDIDVDMIIAPSTSLVNKILSERRAGIYTGDVFVMGAEDLVGVLFPNQAAEPLDKLLILPEVKNPDLWLNGQIPFLDSEHRAIAFQAEVSSRMAYNTTLLKPDEITSFNNLLSPAFKDKIVMLDPTISGSGASWFYLVWKEMGIEYLSNFIKNQPVIIRDSRQLVEWIAKGKFALAIGISTPLVKNFMDSGAPIAMVPPMIEGREIRGGVSYSGVFNKAPHSNEAKVFINWLLSKEGQTALSKVSGVASRRIDVPTVFLSAEAIVDPKLKYKSRETEEDFLEKKKTQQMAQEVFAPLLGK